MWILIVICTVWHGGSVTVTPGFRSEDECLAVRKLTQQFVSEGKMWSTASSMEIKATCKQVN